MNFALRLLEKWRPYSGVRMSGFICGCGHSGTTLMATILSAHPNVYVPLKETRTFIKPNPAKQYKGLKKEAEKAGKSVLIEKTPRHILHLDVIRKVVPDARIIIPVRDGRDVAASIRNRTGSLSHGIGRWIKENRIVLAERGKPDVLVYRYEDFIENPERVTRKICRFLGISFDKAMLAYHEQPRLWYGRTEIRHSDGVGLNSHGDLRNWQVNQPIFDGRGRWKKDLSEADIAPLLKNEGGALMRAFGYL